MKHDEHLLTSALRFFRACSSRTHPAPIDNQQSACVSADSYEPHCLMSWKTMVSATDETVDYLPHKVTA